MASYSFATPILSVLGDGCDLHLRPAGDQKKDPSREETKIRLESSRYRGAETLDKKVKTHAELPQIYIIRVV